MSLSFWSIYMALSERTVIKVLQNQSNSARKVYDVIVTGEPWPVHRIIQEIKNANGGNTPDRKVVSGCLNDLTDAGLLKRTGQDLYSRMPVRATPAKPKKVSDLPPLTPSIVPKAIVKELVSMSKTPTEQKPPTEHKERPVTGVVHPTPARRPSSNRPQGETDVGGAPLVEAKETGIVGNTAGDDPIITTLRLADEFALMGTRLHEMAAELRINASGLEQEREKVRVKNLKIEELRQSILATWRDPFDS